MKLSEWSFQSFRPVAFLTSIASAVEPGTRAQAIWDDWSWSQKLLDGEAGASNLGSGSIALVRGSSELYKHAMVFSF